MFRPTPWMWSLEWAKLVIQVGFLILALVGGIVPIAKWYQERTQSVIDAKPIVVSLLDTFAERPI
jgi:hypothetical protein